MVVFIINGKKLHVSTYSGHLQVSTTFLLKEFYIICLNRVVMLRYYIGILYKTLLARKLSKPEDGRYRSKHVVFSIDNKHHHLAIYL